MPNSDYDYAKYSLERVENNINITRTHAKWLMSLMAIVALGLASFIFKDLGELPLIYKDEEETAQFVKVFAGFLFIFYSCLVITFIPKILWGMKIITRKDKKSFIELNENEKTKIINESIDENDKKLFKIDREFKRLIALSIISPFASAIISASLTYL